MWITRCCSRRRRRRRFLFSHMSTAIAIAISDESTARKMKRFRNLPFHYNALKIAHDFFFLSDI